MTHALQIIHLFSGIEFKKNYLIFPNRLGSSSVRHLSQPCHNPVTTISWSPNGQFFVSGSPADSSMMVSTIIIIVTFKSCIFYLPLGSF